MEMISKKIVVIGVLLLSACKVPAASNQLNEATATDASEPGDVNDVINKINSLIAAYQEAVSPEKRQSVRETLWGYLRKSDERGLLQKALLKLVGAIPQLKDASQEEKESTAFLFYNSIKVELDNRSRFDSWEDVDRKLMAAVSTTRGMALPAAFESLARTDLLPIDMGKLLIDGDNSWELRKQLIESAKKSIWIFCWAIYNDATGQAGVDSLIAKKRNNPQIDIRVMVDGPTQSKPGYKQVAQKLIDADIDIELIRWNHPRLTGFGMHRKIMIFDHNTVGAAAIFGGMNYGDNYSHENPSLQPLDLWRDTDMVVYGQVVNQAAHQFANAWNTFVDVGGTLVSSPKLTKVAVPAFAKSKASSDWMLGFVDQDPSQIEKNSGYIDPVYAVTLKMIDSAKDSVEISNAYFISTLPIERALKRAADRGVQVRVHTNSDGSMTAEDKPLLGPIYGSLRKLVAGYPEHGAPGSKYKAPQLYLQKDHTLHSKYMVVDKMYGWVGSYNIHPRSYRYEGESVGVFYGSAVGAEVHKMFANDANGSDLGDMKSVTLPPNTLFDLLQNFFFEQL